MATLRGAMTSVNAAAYADRGTIISASGKAAQLWDRVAAFLTAEFAG